MASNGKETVDTKTGEVVEESPDFSGVPAITDLPIKDLIMGGSALQQIRGDRITAVAVQKPRSIPQIAHAVLEEAESAGEAFLYKWRQGDGWVMGGTVGLALCIARLFGNSEVRIAVDEYPDHWMMYAQWTDYETGFNITRPFRQRKDQDVGSGFKKDPGRRLDVIFQIGVSKALRNVIFNAVPSWIREQAIERAETSASKAIKPGEVEERATKAIKALDTFSPYEAADTKRLIERERGAPVNKWTPRDIVELRASHNSLKERTYSFGDIFGALDDKAEDAGGDNTSDEEETAAERLQSLVFEAQARLAEWVDVLEDRAEQDAYRDTLLGACFKVKTIADIASLHPDAIEIATRYLKIAGGAIEQAVDKPLHKYTKADWKAARAAATVAIENVAADASQGDLPI
jgi:hypothetical protein